MIIDGEQIPTDTSLDVTYPYTGEVVGSVGALGADQVEQAIEAADRYDHSLTATERDRVLQATADAVEERAEQYARRIVQEIGISLSGARHEVERACDVLRLSGEEAKRITGETLPVTLPSEDRDRVGMVLREPVGTIGCITPFNHPLNQIVHKVGPAIAADNAVVLKPSEKSPLTAVAFAEEMIDQGLPPSMLQVVTGEVDVISPPLLRSSKVGMISFTGSTQAGDAIARSTGVKKLSMELGGNDVLVVAPDADPREAAAKAAYGAYGNSGQRCSAVKRILVFPDTPEAFTTHLVEETKKLRVGDPMDADTDVGTVVDEESAERIEHRIDAAVQAGARLLAGGERDGAQVWPTVLDDVDPASELVQEETFGPVAPIIHVADADEAVEVANGTRYGLNAGILTNDMDLAFRLMREIDVGGVRINEPPSFRSEYVPFGGNKMSGFGRSGIKSSVEEMTNVKTVIL